MIKEAIEKIIKRIDLTEREMQAVFEEIMGGLATPIQIGAFITALRMKGETVSEITGAAKVMREKATHLNLDENTILDTCGTGGSGINKFNISTTVAFVVAGCGVLVAKHGNRSASSRCGSADLLEALGVNLDIMPQKTEECIRKIGIGFLFAPIFHNSMKHAAIPRKEIGIRTIFNILGPLANPTNATCQVLGVYDPELTEVMASVLNNFGTKAAFVIHGLDGLDEVTITTKTKLTQLKDNRIRTYYVQPKDFGLKRARLEDIMGGDVKDNARIVMDVLSGKRGPCMDIVLMNASLALIAAGVAGNFKDGVRLASESIDSKKALDKLEKLKEFLRK